jgi:putative transposase
VAARRADHSHKTARTLARSFDRIGVENLRIKNMLANHRLARAISDAGWGDWLAILAWQAKKAGRDIVVYDPRHTTQTCSACGTKANSHLGLADRTFYCHACGLVLDRDRNAAYNLDPGRAGPGVGVDGTKPWLSAGNQAA